MNSGSEKLISAKLWEELMRRNRFMMLPQVLISVMSFTIYFQMHKTDSSTVLGYIIVMLGCFLRIGILEKFHTKKIEHLFFASVFVISCGWAKLFYDVHFFYGATSPQLFVCLLIIAGTFSAAVTVLAASPVSYILFIIPMSVTTIILGNLLTALLIGIFSAFCLFQLHLSHHYLKSMIQERDKVKSLLDTVPGSVSFIDENLRPVTVNEVGRDSDLHSSEIFQRFLKDFMGSSERTMTSEIRIETHTFLVSVKKSSETLGGAVVVAVPMDELVKARENLRIQEAKSQYSAKLASVGEMAAGIAHEINNPLAIILGMSEKIDQQMSRPVPDIHKVLISNGKIQSTVMRISNIIRSLRGLARNGERDPHMPFEFKSILEPCLEISKQRFKDEKVHLELNHQETSLTVVGQEVQLSQVLMNLINNAFDAAISGPQPRWVKIAVVEENQNLDIKVSDSGHGIPEDIRHRIMEPFFTTKPLNKGTGLGLSISKTIVESHQGSLFLEENTLNTTFVMRLKK